MSTDPLQPLMIKRKVRAAQLVLLNKVRQAQSRNASVSGAMPIATKSAVAPPPSEPSSLRLKR